MIGFAIVRETLSIAGSRIGSPDDCGGGSQGTECVWLGLALVDVVELALIELLVLFNSLLLIEAPMEPDFDRLTILKLPAESI